MTSSNETMDGVLRVVLVDGAPGAAVVIADMLASLPAGGFRLDSVASLAQGAARCREGSCDALLLDLGASPQVLSDFLALGDEASRIPIVILSDLESERFALRALEQGAEDYLLKGAIDPALLARSIRFAAERVKRRGAEYALAKTATEMRIARQIQDRLFPAFAPETPAFDIASLSHPAGSTNGDYFDYIPMPDGRLGVVIGDACGHGVPATLVMVQVQAYLRAFLEEEADIGAVLQRVNRALVRDSTMGYFATLALLALDPSTDRFAYANAGHPAGVVLDSAGGVKATLPSNALPLGIDPDATFPIDGGPEVSRDDVIILFTDGVEEARSTERELFGLERIIAAAAPHLDKPASTIARVLCDAAFAFSRGLPQADDMTVVVLRARRLR